MKTTLITVIAAGLLLISTAAAGDNPVPPERVSQFNLTPVSNEARVQLDAADQGTPPFSSTAAKRPVGSAVSTDVGIGPGMSVDLTWDDAQQTVAQGRHIGHWWNGLYGEAAEVSVHFAYRDLVDSAQANRIYYSGYNVYDAVASGSASWPLGQDVGCDLQSVDTLGSGGMPSLNVMPNGRAVTAAVSSFFRSRPGVTRLNDNMLYYQGGEFQCTYDPRSALNVTWIDSAAYRPKFLAPNSGVYARAPQVVSQWDGTNTVVHLLLAEDPPGAEFNSPDYFNSIPYYSLVYFRKTGSTASSGSWSTGTVIDSLWSPWASMAAGPYPQTGLAVTYTNPTYYSALIDMIQEDLDVWCRESFDRGLTWSPSYSVTNYLNPIVGDPSHFTAWLETQALYSTDGVLQVVWTAKPTSVDPYFDGFNWNDFDQDVYHWAKNNGQAVPGTGDIVRVARGSHEHWDDLCGDFNTYHCGYGGANAGYIANVNISECDDKLYCVWNQIHERANHFDWRCATQEELQGVLDDCSYTGNRLAKANWDIFMSVSTLDNSTLWDLPRNVSNTFTPNCGLPGDPLASGLCGSEYKPSVEAFGFDETGLTLNWPASATVDMTPAAQPPYAGGSFLNLQYLDDQFPGPAYWGGSWTNPPATLNSIKWIRLACVEPVHAPAIAVQPYKIYWPDWVALGTTKSFPVTVTNTGNLQLNVSEIGVDPAGGWLEVSTTTLSVPAGTDNYRSFNVIVDATAFTETEWLDGLVWIKSDAANADSVAVPIRILAAADVEPVKWDTVSSHQYMFDPFFDPTGACVALAVSNNGETGWRGGGSVNLDYRESGLECGTRDADAIYLKSGSPFVMTATSSSGVGAELTCSYMDANAADPNGWDPMPDKPMSGGTTSDYDSVYTGKFVNRDTTIGMERVFYAPRSSTPLTETINFVVCLTKFYSADGLPHNHVTVGNVVDWNVPSDSVSVNASGVSGSGFVYLQGTDTTGHAGCQLNTGRFATEAFVNSYTAAQYHENSCVSNPNSYYSINATDQHILADTTHYRNGTVLIPAQPNPQVWWEECGVPGMNANGETQDQAIWLTYKHDYNLSASDTLFVWTVLTTVRNGTLENLAAQVFLAKRWLEDWIRGCGFGGGCCDSGIRRVGDANWDWNPEPTIGDISVMIDAKFITGACICCGPSHNIVCLASADINQSGGVNPTCDDITISDISILIDYLFITGSSLGLPDCYW